jgi:hypothetical protein
MACNLQQLPRCGAWARSAGRPCLQRAMPNGRCYWHGGSMTVKHGRYTNQAKTKRHKDRQAIREFRETQSVMEGMIVG